MTDKYSDPLLDDKFIDIKDSLNRIELQTVKTNGRVSMHDRLLWLSMGAMPLLAFWAFTLTQAFLDQGKTISPLQQAAIEKAVENVLERKTVDVYRNQ